MILFCSVFQQRGCLDMSLVQHEVIRHKHISLGLGCSVSGMCSEVLAGLLRIPRFQSPPALRRFMPDV